MEIFYNRFKKLGYTEIKDTSNNIVVFKEELTELIQLSTKADDML